MFLPNTQQLVYNQNQVLQHKQLVAPETEVLDHNPANGIIYFDAASENQNIDIFSLAFNP